ncbi:hypothetical protein BG015_008428 [Linnemannia schmuckeri]|uniref:Alpha/beta-hydrolase n=1 Tax=Linnemannia schmuckeri TaxID=64567 RepID=A0A9P5VAN9_9FUNG|nr:hypothetical protein BG015_008428 [Linnemannia schmuckeri]
MLQQFAPRLSAQARLFLRNATIASVSASPFPRRPVLSSTARSWYSSSTTTTPPSDSPILPATTTAFQPVTEESEPTPTNLNNPPSSVSCTISPPSTYAFLKPTPVVLLTGPFGGNWCFRETWQESLADQGYQSTSIELSMPHQPLESGDAYIRHFVKTLKTAIETDHSFYPPILIAHGLHALVAQKYVESNPVSALVLVSPFIPEVIQRRFQELSHRLQLKDIATTTATKQIKEGAAASTSEPAQEDSELNPEGVASSTSPSTPASTSTSQESSQSDTLLTDFPDYPFVTHADVMAQDGFRERYVLPKKAVYKIDQVAKEHQEKEEAELKKKKQQEIEAPSSTAESDSTQRSPVATTATESSSTTTPTSAKEATEASETLGRDSVPVWESKEANEETPQEPSSSNTATTGTQEDIPVLTVESEASIPSPLEQLPLSIYKTIPPSLFEPTFPILLVTSNGDEIVSTNDVKERHILAGQVDHIELEDLDDGGHLIMVSDNTEWEQGIQGITAWLDSNGM